MEEANGDRFRYDVDVDVVVVIGYVDADFGSEWAREGAVLTSRVEELNGADERVRVTPSGPIPEAEAGPIDKGREA